MSRNDTDGTDELDADGPLATPPTGLTPEDLDTATVRIDLDEQTYERLHDAYLRAVEQGYTDGFDTFAYNRCPTEHIVTVDGDPVDPRENDDDV